MTPFPQHPVPAFIFVWTRWWGYGWLIGHLFIRCTLHISFSPQRCVLISIWFSPWHLVLTCVNVDVRLMHLSCCLFKGQWILTHDTIRNIMYAFARTREQWYTLMSGISLWIDLYMTQEQVFVANVMVIDLTWETVAMSVIIQPKGAIVELSAIVRIRKYRRLHDKHHFISMAMEVHLNVIWIVSSRNVLIFSMIDN